MNKFVPLLAFVAFLPACNSTGDHEAAAARGGRQPAAASAVAPSTAPAKPVAAAPATAPNVPTLSVGDFEKTLKAHPEYVLLDVRTPAEFNAGHLQGARMIDFRSAEFDRQIATLDPSKTYLVYCRTGHRSGLACEKLAGRGLKATHLAGGITAWRAANLPTTQP